MLNGARAADTPAQQPNHIEFVINLKTAKLLGIPVSSLLLTQADEVIE
jgi:putative ABC transport system substrate-binding protein